VVIVPVMSEEFLDASPVQRVDTTTNTSEAAMSEMSDKSMV